MRRLLAHPIAILVVATLAIAVTISLWAIDRYTSDDEEDNPNLEATKVPTDENAASVSLKRVDDIPRPGPIAQGEIIILQAEVSNMIPPYRFAWTVTDGSLEDEKGDPIPHSTFQKKSKVWWTAPGFRVQDVVITVTVLDDEKTQNKASLDFDVN